MAIQSNQPKAQKRTGSAVKGRAATQKQAASSSSQPSSLEEERRRLIEEKAYYIAERRGFQGDRVMDDWLQAEREVDAQSTSLH